MRHESSLKTLTAFATITLAAGSLSSAPAGNTIAKDVHRARAVGLAMTRAATARLSATTDPCSRAAELVAHATIREAQEDFLIGLANCVNLTDPEEAFDCLHESIDELEETLEEAGEQYDARMDLCSLLGGGAYDPEYDGDDFVQGIDNPLLPFVVGNTWTYEAETEDGMETVVVTVTPDTIDIDGVECTVVRDTVTLEGELIEDTFDYFAQDVDGNVWYFGELSLNYEDGSLVDIDGSWIAGEEYAKPGIVMFAAPVVGTTYRQEFLIDEAEDAGTVLSLSEDVSVPAGSFTNCLQTVDFTPIEPDTFEWKYYQPGIGLLLEIDLESGERLELISFN